MLLCCGQEHRFEEDTLRISSMDVRLRNGKMGIERADIRVVNRESKEGNVRARKVISSYPTSAIPCDY